MNKTSFLRKTKWISHFGIACVETSDMKDSSPILQGVTFFMHVIRLKVSWIIMLGLKVSQSKRDLHNSPEASIRQKPLPLWNRSLPLGKISWRTFRPGFGLVLCFLLTFDQPWVPIISTRLMYGDVL